MTAASASVHELPREPVTAPARQAVGQFTVTLNLTQQRGITMVGYVYDDDSSNDVHKRIDFYQSVLDRQFIRADLVNKRAQIAGHVQNLANFKQHYDGLVRKQKAGKVLPSTEKDALRNYDTSVAQISDAIDSLKAAIAEGEKQLALE